MAALYMVARYENDVRKARALNVSEKDLMEVVEKFDLVETTEVKGFRTFEKDGIEVTATVCGSTRKNRLL